MTSGLLGAATSSGVAMGRPGLFHKTRAIDDGPWKDLFVAPGNE